MRSDAKSDPCWSFTVITLLLLSSLKFLNCYWLYITKWIIPKAQTLSHICKHHIFYTAGSWVMSRNNVLFLFCLFDLQTKTYWEIGVITRFEKLLCCHWDCCMHARHSLASAVVRVVLLHTGRNCSSWFWNHCSSFPGAPRGNDTAGSIHPVIFWLRGSPHLSN